jgi:uncharacterized tellurite resistance protein B-like protein
MDINLADFNGAQQKALFDLLILAMYADGHLSSVEDKRLEGLLTQMGHATDYDRQQAFDAAVTRMRPYNKNSQTACDQALLIAAAFTTPAQRHAVYSLVQEIVTSDSSVDLVESNLLAALRSQFKL